uniref:NADH-ubiquinone oxidoreductase chain 4 n=1 Tax=Naesiotus nux TaxID=1755238 RepID=A0A0S2IAS8_NAENU|nr:NADH dehydrogenase subunit 4 [Naesiotus nux]ALO20566.1 NADH dehydrogenase subunit 4 [Naesiotus nux]
MMTLTLLYILISLIFVNNWAVSVGGFILSILVAVVNLNSVTHLSSSTFFMNNSMSNIMVLLTLCLTLFILIACSKLKSFQFLISMKSLCIILVCAFSVENLFLFYFLFELSLLPTLYLIISWGYQPERLQAGSYMMLYTVGASLPLLMFILWQYSISYSMSILTLQMFPLKMEGPFFIIIILAFLAKLPSYSFHLWLPKAHVEAPLAGSMILAGVLLKLGGYGLYLMGKLLDYNMNSLSVIILLSVMMWGGFIASLMCITQSDIKAYVAYSSIVHMSFVSTAMVINTSWGVYSSIITMFAHGFTSSGMFILAYMAYKKANSRSLLFMGGYLMLFPSMSLMWFLFSSMNMAAPPTINLVGELMFIGCVSMVSYILMFISLMIMFISVFYNMYLYSSINHGMASPYTVNSNSDNFSSENLSLFLHMSLLLLIFKLNLFSFSTEICWIL